MVMRMNDKAVSPVIGVMLMLVVTVILAAAVSSYSGGMAGDNQKASQMAIKADFSQSRGMTITHMGGDTINTLDTKIVVSPTKDFGSYDQMMWEVNLTKVMVNKAGGSKAWYNSTAYSSNLARTFQPGEMAYISATDLKEVQPETYFATLSSTVVTQDDALHPNYGFMTTTAVGQRMVLTLVDSSGKTIAKTEVVIQS
ncbi:MAG: archaeal type pilus assembly protein PilA [Methanolobus sp.]|jgi:flagellin-like protein|nr:archaeal type pilus assembly protein PilA [Methanolobus sp.]